jgi:hypothetical protein
MTLWFDWGKFKITVCPDCRKNKTILDLNKRISEKYFIKVK